MISSLNCIYKAANRLPLPSEGKGVDSSLPEGLMTNVEAIARQFPDTPLSIWVDIYGVGNHPHRIIETLNAERSVASIRFRALDTIPAYTTNPLFEKPSVNLQNPHDPLWQQVDLARLYILNHCLIDDGEKAPVYTDMDIDLTDGRFKHAGSILKNYDFVVGKKKKNNLIENGFLGITKHSLDFLRGSLVPLSVASIEAGKNGWAGCLQAVKIFQTQLGENAAAIELPIEEIESAPQIKVSYQRATPSPAQL